MSATDYAFEPPIDIDLKGNPGRVRFTRLSEFHKWIGEDIGVWVELSSRFVGNSLSDIAGRAAISDYVLKVTGNRPAVELVRAKDVQNVLYLYENRKVVHSGSVFGRKVIDRIHGGSNISGMTLAVIIGSKIDVVIGPDNIMIFLMASAEASDFVSIINGDDVVGGDSVIAAARNEINTAADKISDASAILESSKKLRDELVSTLDKFVSMLNEEQEGREQRRGEVSKFIVDSKEKFELSMDSMLNSVKTSVGIRDTISYWLDKYSIHTIAGIGLTTFFMSGVAYFIYIVWNYAPIYMSHVGLTGGEADAKIDPVRLVVALVPVVGALWVLRFISRLALGNWARSADASERVAMIKTFLALERDGKTSSVEDRALILKALFRPGPGHGQDDGPPGGGLDILVKLLDGGKGGKG